MARHRVTHLALILCLVGVSAIFGAFALYPNAGSAEYSHTVESVEGSVVPDPVDIFAYGELSPEAQDAFLKALESSDGHAVVHGEENRPPEFQYSDAENAYYIEYEGAHYRLTTLQGGAGPIGFVQLLLKGLLGILGIGLLRIGLYSYQHRRVRPALATLGVLGSLVVVGGVGGAIETMGGPLIPLWAWVIGLLLAIIAPLTVIRRLDRE